MLSRARLFVGEMLNRERVPRTNSKRRSLTALFPQLLIVKNEVKEIGLVEYVLRN